GRHRGHGAGHRCAEVFGIARLDLPLWRTLRHLLAIRDPDRARLTIELEEDRARSIFMRLTRSDVPHNERLAALNIDRDFLARLHAIEEHRRGQDGYVAILQAVGHVLRPDFWIHEI